MADKTVLSKVHKKIQNVSPCFPLSADLFHLLIELGEHEPAVLLGYGALVLLHCAPAERALELLHHSSKYKSSVGDPDPQVFGPPGSGSISQRYGSGSGSGSCRFS